MDVYAIDASGTVVGEDHRDSVIWRDDVESVIDSISAVTAINERDQVIGQLSLGGCLQHAMLRQDGVTTDLGTIGAAASYATAINDNGTIVGSTASSFGTPLTAIEWKDGQLVNLGTFGAIGAEAVTVNDAGDVISRRHPGRRRSCRRRTAGGRRGAARTRSSATGRSVTSTYPSAMGGAHPMPCSGTGTRLGTGHG